MEAGKHFFMEKPFAVDPMGVRSVIVTSELAMEVSKLDLSLPAMEFGSLPEMPGAFQA